MLGQLVEILAAHIAAPRWVELRLTLRDSPEHRDLRIRQPPEQRRYLFSARDLVDEDLDFPVSPSQKVRPYAQGKLGGAAELRVLDEGLEVEDVVGVPEHPRRKPRHPEQGRAE